MACTAITIKVYVREDLFPKRKFVINEADLDYSELPGSIARQCLEYCNMEGPCERQWWDTWKKLVKDELNTRRNHCQNYMKEAYMGKSGPIGTSRLVVVTLSLTISCVTGQLMPRPGKVIGKTKKLSLMSMCICLLVRATCNCVWRRTRTPSFWTPMFAR